MLAQTRAADGWSCCRLSCRHVECLVTRGVPPPGNVMGLPCAATPARRHRRQVHNMRVCSHRARLEGVDGVASGSLAAYSTLVKAGVSCFDIDFVQASRPGCFGHPAVGKLSDCKHCCVRRSCWSAPWWRPRCCLPGKQHGGRRWRASVSDQQQAPLHGRSRKAVNAMLVDLLPPCMQRSRTVCPAALTALSFPPAPVADLGRSAAGHAPGRPAGCRAER